MKLRGKTVYGYVQAALLSAVFILATVALGLLAQEVMGLAYMRSMIPAVMCAVFLPAVARFALRRTR